MIDLLPNSTLLYQWVIFMIAVFTLHFGIFRPALRIIEERQSKTKGAKGLAHDLDQKSQEMLAACEKRMEEARLLGVKKKDEIRLVGEKYGEDLLKRTRADLERQMESSRQKVEQEAKEAALKIRQSIRDLSRDVASKILERNI